MATTHSPHANPTSRRGTDEPRAGVGRVRDVQNAHRRATLPGSTPVLFVPNDLWECQGPCIYQDGLVVYRHRSGQHTARTRKAQLRECRAGDRVLVQFPDDATAPRDEWWLCEVETIDGDDAS